MVRRGIFDSTKINNLIFIQPCFIRKNTPELIEKLEELGYKKNITYLEYEHNLYVGGGIYSSANFIDKYYFDCGTNEELFLTLAALRDDIPIGSWYWFNGKLLKCETLELQNLSFSTAQYLPRCRDVNNPMICFCADEKLLRKATVEEIIKHFKN